MAEQSQQARQRDQNDKIGFWEAVSIGVGGMVGGGIFAVLGLSVQLARGGTPVAFAIAGAVALLTAYSYSKLSVSIPNRGGTVIFLDRAFGKTLCTGSANVLLWLSYVIMLALYAYAFGSYGSSLLPESFGSAGKHALMSLAIIVPTLLNMADARAVAEIEAYVVAVKIAILTVFLAFGWQGIDSARLAPAQWVPALPLVAGGMMIFVAYEGFELIANTAEDIVRPKRTLPLAYFTSVGFVVALYVAIAMVAVGGLSLQALLGARDYALAEAARPFFGPAGFTIIVVAALLSTFSAINATLYGSARLSYEIAKEGELPEELERKIWGKPLEGLLITAVLALALVNVADLSSISLLGSAGFLVIFAAVNAANLKLRKNVRSNGFIAALGMLGCLAAFAAMVWQTVGENPSQAWVLAGLFGAAVALEGSFRVFHRGN